MTLTLVYALVAVESRRAPMQAVTAAELHHRRSAEQWVSGCTSACLFKAAGTNSSARDEWHHRCRGQCQRISARYKRAESSRAEATMSLRALAEAEASAALQRMFAALNSSKRWSNGEKRSHMYGRRMCDPRSSHPRGGVFPQHSREIVKATMSKPYRYYSLVEFGGARNGSMILVFKASPDGASIQYGHLRDGTTLEFQGGTPRALFPLKKSSDDEYRLLAIDKRRIAHNLAVAHLGGGEYVLAGGQGPALEYRVGLGADEDSGIRLARGHGWPFHRRNWTAPRLAITAEQPGGCVDFRLGRVAPARLLQWQLGQATLPQPLCEFDGRLSIVKHHSTLRLYARANLLEGAVYGGRYVQTTASPDEGENWSHWNPVRIRALPAGSADIYFFHVQHNPLDDGETLMAIFPISQPPHACIGVAFSHNGIDFSSPINLQSSIPGWRTAYPDGTGPFEWRNVDHPVAGSVLRYGRKGREWVWFYIHHGVLGTSMGPMPDSHVALYKLPATELRRLMNISLRIDVGAPVPWVRKAGIG